MRAWSLAMGLLLVWALPAIAAEKTIGRQVQTWRPRPLTPLLPEVLGPDPPAPSAASSRPAWEAWMMRLLNGQPLIVFQPSWKGAWPRPQNRWEFSLTPGLRGDPTAGIGAEVVLNGGWNLWGLQWEGTSHLLWAETSGITSWRLAVSRWGWTLEGTGWIDDALRPGETRGSLAYRREF